MFIPPPPAPQSEEQPAAAGAPADLYDYAAARFQQGASVHEVRAELLDRGADEKTASTLIHDLLAGDAGRERYPVHSVGDAGAEDPVLAAARRNMAIGGVVFAIGLIITLATFAAASGPGGGRYIVAWGAIIWGAIQFCQGASQASAARQAAPPYQHSARRAALADDSPPDTGGPRRRHPRRRARSYALTMPE